MVHASVPAVPGVKFGARPVAFAAFALAAAGFGLLTRVSLDDDPVTTILPGFVLAAAGLGAGVITASTLLAVALPGGRPPVADAPMFVH